MPLEDFDQAGQQIREAEYVCFNHLGIGVGAASIERTGARQSGSEQSCFYFQFCNPGRDLLPAIDFTLIGHYDLAWNIKPRANFGFQIQ